MRSAVLPTCSIIWLLTASFSVATETVVGVAGRRVTLPCSSAAAVAGQAAVCWGRGKALLFTCHNTVLVTNGVRVTYSPSYRYRLLSEEMGNVSLTIFNSRQADSGFYHCRVIVPGLFNDQIYAVHLIIRRAPEQAVEIPRLTELVAESSEGFDPAEPYLSYTETERTQETGSGEEWDQPEGPVVASVNTSTESSPMFFVGNTLRMSFLVFIPALLLTIGYRMMRSRQRTRAAPRIPSDPEEDSL